MQVVEKDEGEKMRKLFILTSLSAIISFFVFINCYKEYNYSYYKIVNKYEEIYKHTITNKDKERVKDNIFGEASLFLKLEDKYKQDENYKADVKNIDYLYKIYEFSKYISVILSIISIVLIFKIIINFIKNKHTSRHQRVGFLVFCISIMFITLSISSYIFLNEHSWQKIIDINKIYGLLFWIGISLMLISIPLLTGLSQKIIVWIQNGK